MITALFAVAFLIAAVVGWCGAIEANQRAVRAQACFLTAQETARQFRDERDEQEALAESQGSLIAAYRRANDRLFECLKDHMEADEWAALDPGLSVYDRLVTDVLDRETWPQGGAS